MGEVHYDDREFEFKKEKPYLPKKYYNMYKIMPIRVTISTPNGSKKAYLYIHDDIDYPVLKKSINHYGLNICGKIQIEKYSKEQESLELYYPSSYFKKHLK